MSNAASKVYLKHQVFLAGVALLVLSLLALFFLVVSWQAGGDAFMATLYGKETMVALLAVSGIGIMLMLACRDKTAETAPAALCNEGSAPA